MATIKQIKARILPGHKQVLIAVRDGQTIDMRTMGEARGYLKIIKTLWSWGAMDANGITDLGRELVA